MAFCGFLKQSTAATLSVGPFIDETDGKTAETALTLSQADYQLSKNGGAYAQKNESTSGTHQTLGYYSTPINTTDTATLGLLTLAVHESGALPVRQDYMVLPANVFDSVVSGSDLLQTDGREINGSTTAAANESTAAATMQTGTVDNTAFTATATVLETSSITTAASSHWIGRVLIFTSGTLTQQATRITAYSLSSGRGRFTYDAVTSVPASGVSFVIV